MSLLNDGKAADAGLVMVVVPEDAGLVEDVDLAGDVGLVAGAGLAEGAGPADAERGRCLSSHSDEGRNH